MGQWGNATNQADWKQQDAWKQSGWRHMKRNDRGRPSRIGGRWTSADVAITVIAFMARWELGLAFLALKLWHQASGSPGSTFAFARQKWEQLVGATRGLLSGSAFPVSMRFGDQSSGNIAFDTWRKGELNRIDAEREKLRVSERDFTVYRDELLHAKDREDFDRFMRSRDVGQ